MRVVLVVVEVVVIVVVVLVQMDGRQQTLDAVGLNGAL